MNSIKAFLKEKGLYLVCLALVFAATITGIAAVRSVVRGVEDLNRTRQQTVEEENVWDSPDAAVNQPAQEVPVATAQPSPVPSADLSAQASSPQGAAPSSGASGGTDSSAASSAPQAAQPHTGWNGKLSVPFSGDELVYHETLRDWRTHNGADYAAETQVCAVTAGTVTAVQDDALWGRVVEVTDAEERVWRYCGLDTVQVTERETVSAGAVLGTPGTVPAENSAGTHLHLECRRAGEFLDPEAQ